MSTIDRDNIDTRDAEIGQILNDYLDRKSRGERVTPGEAIAAHPDLAEDLRQHFELLGEILPGSDKLQGLLLQGVLARSADPRYAAELGPYKIIECVGWGGMGIVFKAYEESLDRLVALKILRPELAGDPKALQRFIREAKTAAALRHPNIVTVHAVGRQGDTHYLAMEFIQGWTVAEYIRQRGPLPGQLTKALFAQVLAGLAAAHAAGLIHRDIKSANLLLDCGRREEKASEVAMAPPESGFSPGRAGPAETVTRELPPMSESRDLPPDEIESAVVKIADFGLARTTAALNRVTLSRSILGTIEYMSPEQARGDEHIDQRTDLYSAGVVLYEMLTGRTPFQADSPTAVIHRVLHEEPEAPEEVRRGADAVLGNLSLRLMAKRPEDRVASAEEAMRLLEEGVVARPRRTGRAWRWALVGAALIALLLAGVWSASWRLQAKTGEPKAGSSAGMLRNAWSEPQAPWKILASYGDDPTPRVFHEFPTTVGATVVRTADPDGRGKRVVAVGLGAPLQGDSLFVFDAGGNVIQRFNLSDTVRQWPDCGPPTVWPVHALEATNLDGMDGDEIVVCAHDAIEYPSRISIIDPRTWRLRSTFWHFGQFSRVFVVPDFFGPRRPAIVAEGNNNKLDGFREPRPEDARAVAHYDRVPMLLILDPRIWRGWGRRERTG